MILENSCAKPSAKLFQKTIFERNYSFVREKKNAALPL